MEDKKPLFDPDDPMSKYWMRVKDDDPKSIWYEPVNTGEEDGRSR